LTCRVGFAIAALLTALQCDALGNGVTPYLPLNLEPEIESQIERVLILGDQPVMTRPIPAATVLDALPKACAIDEALCQRVRRYLARYMYGSGLAEASLEGALSSGSGDRTVTPNRYGMREDSHWQASAQAYAQPSDYVLIDAGAVAYEGRTTFTGSMLSLGWDFAQLDIGFRPHWFSPLSDSSMLMSTEAPTMPSITLSNYRQFFGLGLHYELFAARMSNSDRIVDGTTLTAGHPRLAGFHLDVEPASGWSLGLSRLLQYGGGALGGSFRDLLDAFFSPSAAQTSNVSHPQPFGNQEASITSSLLFPGKIPFSVYFEYAGEDTSRGRDYLLGNSSLSAGIHFPSLWKHFDLTLEASEWQNAWYVHTVYLDGMTNYGLVTGNWFGDQRVFGDGVGGHSSMVALGWEPPFGGLVQLRYRTLQNQEYGSFEDYQRYQFVSLGYSRPLLGLVVGGELDEGRDVFGEKFTRLAGFVRYDEGAALSSLPSSQEDDEDEGAPKSGEVFIDTGANVSRQNIDLTSAATRHNGPVDSGYHLGLGARRFVSDHNDLGARLEFDNVQGHSLIGARLIDYRYRFNNPLTFNFFLGAARYDLATPAYGFYYGVGTQWRDILPKWDLGADLRYANSIARDHLLPSDPPSVGGRPDSFYNISSVTIFISRRF
ncbi:MAG TPA: capsule assembly Wzi family protein, partial [Steroidobacteraceae bacterium]|nr:capsule assembly Wzi family protein [Steroidobacteraceae bacterium]